jgi:hypothetical protein
MPVYSPIQASDTAKSLPFQAGTFQLGAGETTQKSDKTPLIVGVVIAVVALGATAFLARRGGSNLRGIQDTNVGKIKLKRAIPAL